MLPAREVSKASTTGGNELTTRSKTRGERLGPEPHPLRRTLDAHQQRLLSFLHPRRGATGQRKWATCTSQFPGSVCDRARGLPPIRMGPIHTALR
jgi:hypothetical protein